MYIERKFRWKTIFNYGSKIARNQGLSEQDIINEISKYRKSKKASS